MMLHSLDMHFLLSSGVEFYLWVFFSLSSSICGMHIRLITHKLPLFCEQASKIVSNTIMGANMYVGDYVHKTVCTLYI